MKEKLEKLSLLGLSFMLISSFSISSALPLMREYYQGYAAEKVELLISMPSFFVMVTLLANGWLTRYLKERQLIILGLLTMTISGLFPFFQQHYEWVLVSRMFFGVGTGMINAKAISIISERYQGRMRVQLLGLRGAAEVVGSAFLTILVGQAIKIHWYTAFLVYGFGFVILVGYLFFVPQRELLSSPRHLPKKMRLQSSEKQLVLLASLIAGWIICINSSISLRIPILVVQQGFGEATDASMVLSFQQLIGIAAGIAFLPLLERWKGRLIGLSILGLGISLCCVTFSPHLWCLMLSAIGTGFFYSLILTGMFHLLSEKISASLLNSATAFVLLGCNAGSALSPYVLKTVGIVAKTQGSIFVVYALSCCLLGFGWLFFHQKQGKEK